MAIPLILVLCEYENAFSCSDSDFLVIAFSRGRHYVEVSPKRNPAVEFGDRNRRVLSNYYISKTGKVQQEGSKKMMTNEEMISYIVETLPTLNRPDLEYFYWLMVENPT